jgi:hypothetical protein
MVGLPGTGLFWTGGVGLRRRRMMGIGWRSSLLWRLLIGKV